MLSVNSVLKYDGTADLPARRIVILWISGDGSTGYSLDLEDPKALPLPFQRSDFERHLAIGACTFVAPNYYAETRKPSDAEIVRRDQRWAALKQAVEEEPGIYNPVRRTMLYQEIAHRGGFTLNTARGLCQTYWRGGKTVACLTPGYGLRGGTGTIREPGVRKLGRPRSPLRAESGLVLNRDQKRAIATISKANYRKQKRNALMFCYRQWLNQLFHEDGVDAKGRPARVLRKEYALTGAPTYEQFKFHFYKMIDVIEARRAADPRRYALEHRPLTGTATQETWGPGSRFLIDATMADIYLVSRDNPNRIVGRPVIYVVIDVWSRLIVGLYVAIEDASWTSAMMALSNAACSKVSYCADHGIEITEDDWPAANIGARLLSDKGEVDGKNAANLVTYFNRSLEAAQAYRGDAKGLVETQFNTLQVKFGEHVPGYVHKDFTKRGGPDYRLDATLDIDAFTAQMIDLVLTRNSKTLRGYDRDQGMSADFVKMSPIELWHWGIQHRSGRSQAWPAEYVRFRLMPTAHVTVDANGISFQGRSYLGTSVLRMMTLARIGKSQSVTISYDPRITDAVYLHNPSAPNGFEVCSLHQNSRAFAGRTSVEADLERQLATAAWNDAQTSDNTSEINAAERMKARIATAKARQTPDSDMPKSHRTKGIRENRRSEKDVTKQLHGDAFRLGKVENPELGNVVTLRPPVSEDYAESTLADFIQDDD